MMNLSLAELPNWNRPVHTSLPLLSPFPYPSIPAAFHTGLYGFSPVLACSWWEMESPEALGEFLGWSMFIPHAVSGSRDDICTSTKGFACHGPCVTVELLMVGKMLSHIILLRNCVLFGAVHLGMLRELFFQCW